MVSKQIVGIFFRYKTLMSIKWFESVIWLEKMGISSHVLSFLSNAESMTYVLCIKVRRILWKKKKKKQKKKKKTQKKKPKKKKKKKKKKKTKKKT